MGTIWLARAAALCISVLLLAVIWLSLLGAPDVADTAPAKKPENVLYVHSVDRVCWDGKPHPKGCPF